MRYFLFILFLITFHFSAYTQNDENSSGIENLYAEKVRISGILIDEETNKPVPYAAVYIKNTLYGTVTDQDGFFTILAHPSDTLVFAEAGYETTYTVIPVETRDTEFSIVERLRRDEMYLPELSVYPWQDLKMHQFDNLGTELKDDVFIQSVEQNRRLRSIFDSQYQREWIYYNGWDHPRLYRLSPIIFPPNNFLNPYHWVEFKNAWEMRRFNDQEVHLDLHHWQWNIRY